MAKHCNGGNCRIGASNYAGCLCYCDGCDGLVREQIERSLAPRFPTSREEAFLAAVLAGLPKARAKHPDGQRFIGVAAEFGEVANAIDKGEGQERLYSECVDLAICTLRLAIEGNGTR